VGYTTSPVLKTRPAVSKKTALCRGVGLVDPLDETADETADIVFWQFWDALNARGTVDVNEVLSTSENVGQSAGMTCGSDSERRIVWPRLQAYCWSVFTGFVCSPKIPMLRPEAEVDGGRIHVQGAETVADDSDHDVLRRRNASHGRGTLTRFPGLRLRRRVADES